ncbi:DTW domain-containing protein [Vibrio sp. SCSIO 43132]|uniref:tRNA-uridine aminocarboxypropyltransferase n=1 Tax=Vibrio sp. SCSIO 43132 TaxID=2779363 RepID=UPI001CA96CCB|nr:DTW domain-containing protein [Vibrio sp. SCSIO 43132]UAB69388.1 DTW domain-containing protein [Vibrio sp. SCSIO 43132]
MSDHQSETHSRYCQDCGKAKKMCICHTIQSLHSEVELLILQHPDEVNRAMGTARILKLSLANTHVLIGEDFTNDERLAQLLEDDAYHHCVLFPQKSSLSVSEIAKHKGKKLRVILLDGTWKKAYKMWRLNTMLHDLPCIALPENLEGNYRIRKAPSSNSLSTVEAGFHVLRLLDSSRDFSPLLESFERMVDMQFSHIPPHVRSKNY